MAKSKKKSKSASQKITERIITMLEQGTIAWRKSWTFDGVDSEFGNNPHNPFTPTLYSGGNAIWLRAWASMEGFNDPRFVTYNQAKNNGGHVMSGQKGFPVVKYAPKYKKDSDGKIALDDSGQKVVDYLFPVATTVFNVQQTEGLDLPELVSMKSTPEITIKAAQAIVDGYTDKPQIAHDGVDKAYYAPSKDSVHMPLQASFTCTEAYYSVLFHELAHSTGHETRLNRPLKGRTDTYEYAFEELIAEFTAAILCAETGIETQVVENQAAYIQGWKSYLSENKNVLTKAISAANKAAKYMQKAS